MSSTVDSNSGIYYFLGNITSHIIHALPLYKELGGTFVVLSSRAKREVERYGVPVIALDNKPYKWKRYGYRLKPIPHYLEIDERLRRTTDFLNKNAKVVLFYELYDFAEPVRLTKPKTVFLTHGNMLKDYMSAGNRMEILKQYDYMAAMGPYMKHQLLDSGVESSKLVDVGIARTDEIVKGKGKVIVNAAFSTIPHFNAQKRIVAYLPTFWGPSSVYDTGLEIVRNMPEEFTLLFRPHPQTPKRLLKKYHEIIASRTNALYVPEGRYKGVGLVDVFNASSVIIGDVSSVMLEALLTEKPLVFAYGAGKHHQNKEEYAAISDIVATSGTITGSTVLKIGHIIHDAMEDSINHTVWQQAIHRTFFHADGSSVIALRDFVRSLS